MADTLQRDALTVLRDRWRGDAALRKQRIASDPIADALELCAAELDQVLVHAAETPLSPAEYAVRMGVSVQAVTHWCRTGRLEAYRDHLNRWRIPPTSELARADG